MTSAYPPTDSSNAMPTNGYLFPLLPRGYFRSDALNARAIFGGLDVGLDGARTNTLQFKGAHLWAYAAGDDLDDLGAIVGVTRFNKGQPNQESDVLFRQRMQAWAKYAPSASTNPGMAQFLSASLGITVLSRDVSPGAFQVVVMSNTPLAGNVLGMARSVKAAGMKVSGVIYTSRRYIRPSIRAGDVRMGTATMGTSVALVPLTG